MTEQRFIITENMMDSLYGSDNAKYDQHANMPAALFLHRKSGNLKARIIIVSRRSIPFGSAWIRPAGTAILIATT